MKTYCSTRKRSLSFTTSNTTSGESSSSNSGNSVDEEETKSKKPKKESNDEAATEKNVSSAREGTVSFTAQNTTSGETSSSNSLNSINEEEIKSTKPKIESNDEADSKKNMDDLQCAICTELFIEAVKLGCLHTFCSYCITTWKRRVRSCPICRMFIAEINPVPSVDDLVIKIINSSSVDVRAEREEIIRSRKQHEEENESLLLGDEDAEFNNNYNLLQNAWQRILEQNFLDDPFSRFLHFENGSDLQGSNSDWYHEENSDDLISYEDEDTMPYRIFEPSSSSSSGESEDDNYFDVSEDNSDDTDEDYGIIYNNDEI